MYHIYNMLLEYEVSLQDIIDIEKKADLKTLADVRSLKCMYGDLLKTTHIRGKGRLTKDQTAILPHVEYLIRKNVPKLVDILALYGISITDVFEGEDSDDCYYGYHTN